MPQDSPGARAFGVGLDAVLHGEAPLREKPLLQPQRLELPPCRWFRVRPTLLSHSNSHPHTHTHSLSDTHSHSHTLSLMPAAEERFHKRACIASQERALALHYRVGCRPPWRSGPSAGLAPPAPAPGTAALPMATLQAYTSLTLELTLTHTLSLSQIRTHTHTHSLSLSHAGGGGEIPISAHASLAKNGR